MVPSKDCTNMSKILSLLRSPNEGGPIIPSSDVINVVEFERSLFNKSSNEHINKLPPIVSPPVPKIIFLFPLLSRSTKRGDI